MDRRTDGQTQAKTIPLRPERPRGKNEQRYNHTILIYTRIHDVIDDVIRSQNKPKNISVNISVIILIKYPKCRKWSRLSCWHCELKMHGGPFENVKISNTTSIWPQIWKDCPKLCYKCIFHGDDIVNDVIGWPESCPLYSCLGEVGSGCKLQGQYLVNKCEYYNQLSRSYMPKEDLNE